MEENADGVVAKWVAEIKLYEKDSQDWTSRSKKIIRRYKDERSARDSKSRFNILWSNIQTLKPALYAQPPKPNVDRRYQDDDDLGRISAQVLERSVSYFVATDTFDSMMQQSVLDRLLPGRGTAWVRYVPNFKDATITGSDEVKREGIDPTDDAVIGEDASPDLYSEEVLVDHINWQDFGYTYGRTWEEVRAVWKIAYMTRSELVKRFPDVGKEIPLDYSPEKLNDTKIDDTLKKAAVYEIWDKPSKKAIWIHKDYPKALDERDDPLKLHDFFPCPKPLFSTLANDSLVPVPDYVLYQDQARELDELTGRIWAVTKAIKVAGVYDASAEGVQRLLAEGVENTLIPISQWAVFGDKGGLAGVINFLPIKEIAEVLLALYKAQDYVKQIIYEITGISDIIRGASDPNETLGAQELKGKFASLRLDDQQKEVARYGRDLVRIMTEIIAEHFSIETIKQICGVKLMTAQEKKLVQQGMQAAQASGKEIPPMPEEIQELMDLPTWEEVEKLIRNDTARCFRIDIETDSTIKTDQDAEKKARTEFLAAAGGFIQQMQQVQNPQLQPLLMEMLMFGIRSFKVGREMESEFKSTIVKMRKQAEQPPQPDPEIAKHQMEMQQKREDAQATAQTEAQRNAMEDQREANKLTQESQIKREEMAQEAQLESLRLDKEAETTIKVTTMNIEKDIIVAQISAASAEKTARVSAKATLGAKDQGTGTDYEPDLEEPDQPTVGDLINVVTKGLTDVLANNQQLHSTIADGHASLVNALTRDKEVIRDPNGRPIGMRIVK